jgi:hypothetical protein
MLRSFLFFVAVQSLVGCATIAVGAYQNVTINSVPTQATVTVYQNHSKVPSIQTQTPSVLRLKRGEGYFKSATYHIIVEKDGYMPHEIILEGKANKWYLAGNIFGGGLYGYLLIDPNSGAMWTLSPTAPMYNDFQGGLFIDMIGNASPSVRPYLTPVNCDPPRTR